MKKLILSVALLLLMSAGAWAQQPSCLVDFYDSWALGNYYGQARMTFGLETSMDGYGRLQVCPGVDDWRHCWAYRQQCRSTDFHVNVWPWGYSNHNHVPFSSLIYNMEGCFCDPHDGLDEGIGAAYGSPPVCNTTSCPKWELLDRAGATVGHVGSDWMYIYVEKWDDGRQHVFNLREVTVGATSSPIQLWMVTTDGETWGYNSLPGDGVHLWIEFPNVTSAWIGNASGYENKTPALVADVVVQPVQ